MKTPRSQWRARYVGTVKWKRFAEPMVYMFIFSTIAMTLPFAFRCRESGCFIDAGELATSSSTFLSMHSRWPRLPLAEGNVECSADNTSLFLHTVVESTTETFICRSVRPHS